MKRLGRELLVPTVLLTTAVFGALGYLGWSASRELAALERDAAGVRAATALALSLTEAAEDEERWIASVASLGSGPRERRVAQASARIDELAAEVERLALSPRALETWGQHVEARRALRPVGEEVVAAARAGDHAAAASALERWYLLNDRADRLIRNFTAYHLNRLDRAVSDLERRSARAFGAAAGVIVAGLLLAAAFATLLTRTVVRPIVAMADAATHIAATGTASPVTGASRRDELGVLARAFNHMTERLVSTNATLARANASLEQERARKNDFIALLSHELRNPLAPIRNSVFVLERAPPGSAQAARATAVIARQVEQLARLVEDLLDVTRITRGKVTLRRQRVELGELVARSLDDHRGAFADRSIEVRLERPPVPVQVDADPHRISQVVGNLLQNAAKFTPAGGRVAVSLSVSAEGEAVVRVSDSGSGIAPDVLPRLFVPFVQADATLDRSKGGLGLGLALVKGIVEQHGGSVEARSDGPGRGAEFTVRLPLEPSGAPARGDDPDASPP